MNEKEFPSSSLEKVLFIRLLIFQSNHHTLDSKTIIQQRTLTYAIAIATTAATIVIMVTKITMADGLPVRFSIRDLIMKPRQL